MTPQEYCKNKAAQSGSNFYYSFLTLNDERREGITALYAFCREVDDIVDSPGDNHIKQIKLDWWREEINKLYTATPDHPIAQALADPIRQFRLAQEHFMEIIDGMEMDLHSNRYSDFKTLSLYCHRVAGVVGLLSAEIFGYQNRQTLKYAHNLGIAFQLTNIIRDIYDDMRHGRVYLPQDELRQFGISENQIHERHYNNDFEHFIQYQIHRATEYYERAMAQLPEADRYNQRAGLIMAAIYRQLLKVISEDAGKILQQRVRLNALQKFWIAWRTGRRETRRHQQLRRKTADAE